LFWEIRTHATQKFGEIFPGVFTPVLAKHTKSFNLIDTLSVGVGRIQRNFEPLQRQVETSRKTQITDERAKLIFYNAFIDGAEPRAVTPQVADGAVWCDQFVTNRHLQALTEPHRSRIERFREATIHAAFVVF
jgi:hypothetical protein